MADPPRSIRNTARPRRTCPLDCNAIQPSTPAKPDGCVSPATENPPCPANTRAIEAASKARSASGGGGALYLLL